jgi:uncharacterized damage-inducible protein DinB
MAASVPPSTDERTLLLGFLSHQRYAAKLAAYGLTEEQFGATPTASALSVGGVIKHLAATERSWMATVRQVRQPASVEDYLDGFRVGAGQTIASIIEDYDRAAAETDATIAALDLDDAVPVPKGVPWFPADVEAWSVRWVLLHLIEETARHAGHADIVRESVDGATAYPLLAAAEGWPSTEWLQPWQPKAPEMSI